MVANQRLLNIVELIETNLAEPLSVEELANAVGWSRWQLQRTFRSKFDYSISTYYRKRRISHAAIALISTPCSILEIALSCGFENQQSFSRAFAQSFGLAPGKYRTRRTLQDLFPKLDPSLFSYLNGEIDMEPEIKIHPGKTLWGLNTTFNAPGSPHPNNMEKLPALWMEFQTKLGDLEQTPAACWGVVDCSTANDDLENLTYWASFENDEAKAYEGLQRLDIPEQTYACFIHKGPVHTIGDTLTAIFRDWLPNSEYCHTGGPELELYDERFAFDHPDSVLEYWVPVRKVS